MYSVSLVITSPGCCVSMRRNYIEKCEHLSWISTIQWIHSAFLRNNSFSDIVAWQAILQIHVCYEQLIVMCNAIYIVKCFWSSNVIYICFIILCSISGLTAYKEFYTFISNSWTILYIFPMLPGVWILQLWQLTVLNSNSRIRDSTIRNDVCIWQAKEIGKKANTNYSSPVWPLVWCTGCVSVLSAHFIVNKGLSLYQGAVFMILI